MSADPSGPTEPLRTRGIPAQPTGIGPVRPLPSCLADSRSLQATAAQIVARVQTTFASDTASILLLDETGRSLRILAHVGLPAGAVDRTTRVPVSGSISGVALRERRPLLLSGDLKGTPLERMAVRGDLTSALSVPIEYQRQTIGVLNAGRRAGRLPYSDEDATRLRDLAREVGDALERTPVACRVALDGSEACLVEEPGPTAVATPAQQPISSALHLLQQVTDACVVFILLLGPEPAGAQLHLATRLPLTPPSVDGLVTRLAALLAEQHGLVMTTQAITVHWSSDSPGAGARGALWSLGAPVAQPLKRGDGLLGLVGCAPARPGACSLAPASLQALAEVLSAGLANAALLGEAQRRLAQGELLNELAAQLAGIFRLDELQEAIHRMALAVSPEAEAAWVCLLDEASAPLQPAPAGDTIPVSPSPCSDLIGRALREGKTLYYPDVQPEGSGAAQPADPRLRAIVVAPLIIRERPLGALCVASGSPGAFGAAQRHLLAALAVHAAEAIEKAQLYGELRRQKRHMEAVIQHMADGLIVLDPDRRVMSLNPAAERMLGLTQSEALGQSLQGEVVDPRLRSLARICRPDARPETIHHPALLDAQEPEDALEVVVDAPGPRVLKVLSSPLESSLDELGGEIKVLHDVTRERELDQMKDDFVSTVSHELRTPLFSIKGFVDLILQGKVPDAATQREFLTRVAEQAKHLTAIVSDLLDASRLEAGSVELARVPVDLAKVIRLAMGRLEAFARSREVTIELEVPPDLPLVSGDARRLEQVVTNLVSNACKFSHPRGKVEIRCEASEHEVLVHVADHGTGIPPSAIPRLFTPFYQVDSSATRRAGGTGLGLHISRRIIEAHGGRITVESQLGQGSTFTFSVPSADEE